jgi:hypothetical protein
VVEAELGLPCLLVVALGTVAAELAPVLVEVAALAAFGEAEVRRRFGKLVEHPANGGIDDEWPLVAVVTAGLCVATLE